MQEQGMQVLRSHYPFAAVCMLGPIGGHSAANSLFEAAGGPYVLKCFAGDQRQKAAKIGLMLALLRAGDLRAPRLVPAADGSACVVSGGDTFLVTTYLDGQILHRERLSQSALQATAQFAARLHGLGQDLDDGLVDQMATGLRRLLDFADDRLLEAVLNQRRCADDDVRLIAASMQRKKAARATLNVACLLHDTGARDLCHGDFHNENLLYSAELAPVALLDLEHACLGSGIVDIVNFSFMALCGTAYGASELGQARDLVQAYAARATVSKNDIAFAVEAYFLKLVGSTFLERCVAVGHRAAVALVQRDLLLVDMFAQRRGELVHALMP